MAVDLPKAPYAYFDNSMGLEFNFPRPINRLIITVVSGTVELSLDDGTNYMPLVVGTHQLDIYRYSLKFQGGGTFAGFGVSL
jgi:hypothetical protein